MTESRKNVTPTVGKGKTNCTSGIIKLDPFIMKSIISAVLLCAVFVIKNSENENFEYVRQALSNYLGNGADYMKAIEVIGTALTNEEDLSSVIDNEAIKVFVYPSIKMFNQVFCEVIEKRYYNRRRSLEDFYVVQDSEGNIHIASPRGKSTEKVEALKKILVLKVLGEYMDEKDKQMADKMLKASMMKKKEKEEEDKEQEQSEE